MPRSAARATNSTSSPLAQLRDDRARGGLDRLADQQQRVIVVRVDDDDREVGVLADDQLGGLLDGDRERRHVVPEALQDVAERAERLLVLVGEQHGEVGFPPHPG